MLPNRAANFPVGLNLDEDYDENKDLKEFYETNLPLLFTCRMNLIPYDVIMKIAVMIFTTLTYPTEWRMYATEMKISNDTMDEIAAGAFTHAELPIFFAMDKTIRKYGTFGNIIHALLKTDRYDVLRKIEPFVRNILPTLSHMQNSNSASSVTCKNENDAEKYCTFKNISAFSNEQKCELNSFQQTSINAHFKKGLQVSDSSKFTEESLEEIKVPSAPEEEKISVLIPHAKSESNIAEQLSEEFRKEGVFATTLTQVNNFTQYGSDRILNTVFNQVDFIVPIVSSEFMQEIYPGNSDLYMESPHAENNNYLYTLIMTEYKKNGCINFRVRPVIVPGMSRRLISDPILSYSFRLDKEIPKLIKILKETKDLNAQQMVQ